MYHLSYKVDTSGLQMEMKPSNHHRNGEIDYLRAYAVLAVVVLHVFGTTYPTFMDSAAWPGIKYAFDAGVDIFFVISGFVISDAYRRLSAKGLRGGELYKEFMVRRIVRLWPASTFWLLICLAGSIVFYQQHYFPDPEETFNKVLSGIIYTYNITEFTKPSILGYFWSLSVEWQFYLILPAILLLPFQRRLSLLIAGFILLSFWHPGGSGWWMFRFDGILIGMIIYELLDQKILQRFIPGNIGGLASAILTAVILLEIFVAGHYIDAGYLGLSVQCLLAGALVAFSSQERGLVSAFGMHSLMRWVGLRSYSIYLCHIPVVLTVISIWKMLDIDGGWIRASAVSVVTIAICSELSYRALEQFGSKKARKSIEVAMHS